MQQFILNYNIMQMSLDQKIQQATGPLLERINALEAQSNVFKQQILSLQNQTQYKSSSKPSNFENKPVNKTAMEHVERPHTAKNIKKESQYLQPKHQAKVLHKSGQKKEEHKVQNEEGKIQGSKVVPAKTPILSIKALVSPITHKDINDPKNVKSKPISHPVSKPTNAEIMSKVSPIDKKQPRHKNPQGQFQKKEVEQDKKHASKQRQHKVNSIHGVRTPAVNKNKPAQSQPINKKNTIQTKPEPKPLKGEKPRTTAQIKSEKVQKEEHAPKVQETQLYSPDQESLVIAKQQGAVAEHAYLQMQHLPKPEQKKQEMEQKLKKSQQKDQIGVKTSEKPQSKLVGIHQQTS